MIDLKPALTRFNSFSIGARIIIGLAGLLLIVGLGIRASEAIHTFIYGDTEAARQHGNAVVAQEQTKAEGKIADAAVQSVHERDVYREHVTEVVRQTQESIHAADKGQQMDPQIDAAVAAGLCGVHDSLCRRAPAAPVQPVR